MNEGMKLLIWTPKNCNFIFPQLKQSELIKLFKTMAEKVSFNTRPIFLCVWLENTASLRSFLDSARMYITATKSVSEALNHANYYCFLLLKQSYFWLSHSSRSLSEGGLSRMCSNFIAAALKTKDLKEIKTWQNPDFGPLNKWLYSLSKGSNKLS